MAAKKEAGEEKGEGEEGALGADLDAKLRRGKARRGAGVVAPGIAADDAGEGGRAGWCCAELPEELNAVRVLATMVGGSFTYVSDTPISGISQAS